MSSISYDKTSYVDSKAGRILLDEPTVPSAVRRTSQALAVALTAAMLAACAQSSVVTNKSASLAASGQASPERNANASFVTNRSVAVVTKKHTPFATNGLAAGAQNASYGLASYYTYDSKTANGEKFDPHELTAAHRTLPFGTQVRVTDVATGRSVTVRVNDRGPFVAGRVIDVSYSAAETLGITGRGVANVKLDVVE